MDSTNVVGPGSVLRCTPASARIAISIARQANWGSVSEDSAIQYSLEMARHASLTIGVGNYDRASARFLREDIYIARPSRCGCRTRPSGRISVRASIEKFQKLGPATSNPAEPPRPLLFSCLGHERLAANRVPEWREKKLWSSRPPSMAGREGAQTSLTARLS